MATIVNDNNRYPFRAIFQHVVGGNSVQIATLENARGMDEPEDEEEDFYDD